MTVSAAMIDHLGSNVTFLIEIWKMVARDGTVAAFAAHQWNLTFNSQLYTAALVEPSRMARKIGLEANDADLEGIYDDVVTEADIRGGKWKRARITREIVNYFDLTMGSVDKHVGFVGKFSLGKYDFTVEFQSNSSLLGQEIGELTSPTDRNRTLDDLGVTVATYTFARTVTASPDRRHLTVNGTAKPDNYFQYGKVTFTSGANNGYSMEIKSNTGNAIELFLPMIGNIGVGDTVSLVAGYDKTRDAARDKFSAAINFDGEPDLPGISQVYTYPPD
jgi:uncharacterized phage protein (TIGR02218 family)